MLRNELFTVQDQYELLIYFSLNLNQKSCHHLLTLLPLSLL